MERERWWRGYITEELGPHHSCLLACFVVNDKKKPEGDVPSKHLSDCLEYGFISDHRENIHF